MLEHASSAATTLASAPVTPLERLLGRELRGCLRVIDVGARDGFHPLFHPLAGITEIVGFEPDADACPGLRDREPVRWASSSVRCEALAATVGRRTLYVTRRRDLSSLLRPHASPSPDWDVIEERQVETTTLSELRTAGELAGAWDYLKIDVQGLEGEVLAGAPHDLVDSLVGIEIECRMLQHYVEQTPLTAILSTLLDSGFHLAAFDPVFSGGRDIDGMAPWPPTRRVLSHGDLLFLRRPEQVDAAADRRDAALRLVTVAVLHGFWSHALQVADLWLPELVPELSVLVPNSAPSLRWRVGVVASAMRAALDPRPIRRFRLVHDALRLECAAGTGTRLSPPKA